jgi:carotenoid cleavage dioxygenase
VDLTDGTVHESRFDDRGQGFPRVDERLAGKRHRYGYTPTVGAGETGDNALLKHDFVQGSTNSRSFGKGTTLGEFVFHPASPDSPEDDGVLMGYMHDRATDRSALTILDAQTLQDIASIKLPPSSTRRIPRQLGAERLSQLARRRCTGGTGEYLHVRVS